MKMDINPVENTIRPITLNRKTALFAPLSGFWPCQNTIGQRVTPREATLGRASPR
ncbi:MAG: hypothetical protein H7245_16550 [Candidatus Saccharibacteria bacterium]|nr:hypothetical protein [Pseudorhodobacter sp.]